MVYCTLEWLIHTRYVFVCIVFSFCDIHDIILSFVLSLCIKPVFLFVEGIFVFMEAGIENF